jgi:uncharacterized protein YecE (DUF72 family)
MNSYIGTSGWWYPHWHKDEVFYPKWVSTYKRLEYYASQLDAVEVNSTFYEIPPKARVERWVDRTPDKFRFVFKVPKLISHQNAVNVKQIELFKEIVEVSKEKFAGVLMQFPASKKADLGWLSELMYRFIKSNISPVAVEFRSSTWFANDIVDKLLTDFYGHIIIVSAYDNRSLQWIYPPNDDKVYLRFHGAENHGYGSYSETFLAKALSELADDVKDFFAFFNNDMVGAAPNDAKALKTLVELENSLGFLNNG